MIVAVVRFMLDPPLTSDEAAAAFEASAPNYQNVPGLLRKHYLLGDDGHVGGGVYLWESQAAAEALYDGAWRERLEARYGHPPTVEFYESSVTVDPERIEVRLNAARPVAHASAGHEPPAQTGDGVLGAQPPAGRG